MSDRLTLGISDSGSDSETGDPTDNAGEGGSSLGAVGQDRDGRSGKSGGGDRSSRGSLTSPGHIGPQELGARPRKKTGVKGEKDSKPTAKGVVWNKKDRKRAKCYKGKGQQLAAERAAKDAAQGRGSADDKPHQEVKTKLKLGPGPRSGRGPGRDVDQHSKRKLVGGSSSEMFSIRGLVMSVLVFALSFVVFTYDLLSIDSDQNRGSITGINRVEMAQLGIGSLVGMLIFLAMLVSALSNRNSKT